MDQLSIHPYPNPNSPTDSPDVGYTVADHFGVAESRPRQAGGLRRLQRDEAADDAERAHVPHRRARLADRHDGVPPVLQPENVKVISEQQQADYLKTTAEKWFACDPTVIDVELFLLADEPTATARARTGAPCSAAAGRAACSRRAARASRSRSSRTRSSPPTSPRAAAPARAPWSPGRRTGSTSRGQRQGQVGQQAERASRRKSSGRRAKVRRQDGEQGRRQAGGKDGSTKGGKSGKPKKP